MFEKDEDYKKARKESKVGITKVINAWSAREEAIHDEAFQNGAEFGYNKGKEEAKYDLMMKLKDEGLVKPLKDSILRNERLSCQEQQELCAWIECAMDFGENLDECAKKLEEANKANEWNVETPSSAVGNKDLLLRVAKDDFDVGYYHFENQKFYTNDGREVIPLAWKEIHYPQESER